MIYQKKKELIKEVDEKIIFSIGLFDTFNKLNKTIEADRNSIKRLIEQRNALTEENEILKK